MKRTWMIVAGLSMIGLMAPASFAKKPKGDAASGGVFAKYDTNHDGQLDASEKDAVRAALATDSALKAFDVNNDGKLDDNEIAAIKPETMKKKKKNK